MTDWESLTKEHRVQLNHVVTLLHQRYPDVLSRESIAGLVLDSYTRMAARATVTKWLVPFAEKLAKERLEALTLLEESARKTIPTVLFLCTHNDGRSQMALGWFGHLSGNNAIAWSGGSEPAGELNKVAVQAMSEVGIDISQGFPKPWTDEVLAAAHVVVTMGCGDSCPVLPGKEYEEWDVADPAGQPLEVVEAIRDDLEARVRNLLARIGVNELPPATNPT
jgi:arsenate reductase (thioredoxin)